MKTFPLSHISSTPIIIHSHQWASLTPTSLSNIYYISIIIIRHLTTFTPPHQSSRISAATAAAILLNHNHVPRLPPSFYCISTPPLSLLCPSTTVYIIPLLCSICFAPFSAGEIISLDPRLATATLATSMTESADFTFLRSLIYLIWPNHSYSILL